MRRQIDKKAKAMTQDKNIIYGKMGCSAKMFAKNTPLNTHIYRFYKVNNICMTSFIHENKAEPKRTE